MSDDNLKFDIGDKVSYEDPYEDVVDGEIITNSIITMGLVQAVHCNTKNKQITYTVTGIKHRVREDQLVKVEV